MARITFQGQTYECSADEPLLEALNRKGCNLPYGCRAGVCQACMLKATRGTPPATAQVGLEKKLQKKNYFLSCLCRTDSDMEVALPDPADKYHASIVFEKEFLSPSVIRLRSSRPDGFTYQPGQFVNLLQPDLGLARSYSLASTGEDNFLEFHIRLIPGGRMSGWIADTVENGTFIFVSDAMGNCCYNTRYSDSPLLLAGTGTGLAPLYGILRDAIGHGHQKPVELLHGGLNSEGLYYRPELQQLAERHDCFTYRPCVLNGDAPAGGVQGAIDEQLQQLLKSGHDWRIFLCGDSDMVNTMRKLCLAHGIDESDIHTDAFG